MIKLITFLKRKPGMTRQEFIDYYESNHRVIGEKVLRGSAVHYTRRFLHPVAEGAAEPPFDVVMEIWYPDRETLDATMARITGDPDTVKMIQDDEARLFDGSPVLSYIAEEYVSEM